MFKSTILFFIIYIYINLFKFLDYAVFNESWKIEEEIDYPKNTDWRKVFLMELYAWTEISNQISYELLDLDLLSNKSNLLKTVVVFHCNLNYYKNMIFLKVLSIS